MFRYDDESKTQEEIRPTKVVIIGDSGVGKTSLLACLGQESSSINPTLGVDFLACYRNYGNHKIKFNIWDTSGQDRFRKITESFYKGTYAFILMFDTTNRESFDHLDSWLNVLDAHMSDTDANKQAKIILVANKSDRQAEQVVTQDEIDSLKSRHQRILAVVNTHHKNKKSAEKILFLAANSRKASHHIDRRPDDYQGNQYAEIIKKLNDYIARIESYKGNYESGFHRYSLFKSSQAANREANYELAKKMLRDLKDPRIVDKSIIFKNVYETRKAIIKQRKIGVSFWRRSSIRSHDLNAVIKLAKQGYNL